MAAVDSFHLLYREIARSCNCYVETLAVVGAFYTASKAIVFARDCYRLIRLHFIPRLMHNRDLVRQFGEWAVIYGASEAIARAYAEELARHGVGIILISRDSSSVESTARAIADSHGVQTVLVQADFSQGHNVCSTIKDALRNKEIGFLVNSVDLSLDCPQSFTDLPEDQLWDTINRNVTAATLLTRIVLPGMVERGRGAVVNISSGRCCKPTPNKAAFSASTAYLDHVSRALHYEYGHRGILVQSLVPFGVATQQTSERGRLRGSGWLLPEPHVYARHAISTLGISHRTTGYWPHSLQFWLLQYMPEWMWVWGTLILT
ncbi:inactive hydroxysteroid dehydrogenase-like protein 1 [Megalops cyprinoides]|uniref:inactive hydroxysteroid dehydrogenase-like protein 1 n=1 Tax=Megalops cyprinoides TaxID=118141 RepID=UPI001864DEC6|nr:inactive hydroxysteroid dehydrogenase-like protein 1 [Megalops cyprinoides]